MNFGTWKGSCYAVRNKFFRFWPACLIFTVLMVLHVLTIEPPKTLNDVYSIYFSILMASIYGSLYGGICAILLFRDLFNRRYAVAVHALPQTREAIFLGNFLSGLALVLVPMVPAFFLLVPKLEGNWGQALLLYPMVLMYWLYGFAIGSLGANLSGTAFGAVSASVFLTFGIPFGESFVDLILTELLPGITSVDAVPATIDCSFLLALIERDYDKGLPWGFLSIWGVVSILLLGCALWLYKKRKLEAAGDFAAFSGLKPVLKALFTFFGGVILGVILCAPVNDGPLTEEYDLWNTLGWLLPGNLLAVLIGEMLVEKTVRVFKGRQLLRYGLCALLTFGVCALIWADPAGISTKVPGQEEISCVYISDGTYGFTAESPEAIAAVLQLHQTTTEDLSPCVKYPTGDELEFHYTLKNGKVMVRKYVFEYYDHQSLTVHPHYNVKRDFFDNTRWALSCCLGQELPEEALTGQDYDLLYYAKATVIDEEQNLSYTLYSGDLKKLLYCIGQDMEAGKLELQAGAWPKDYYYSILLHTDLPTGGWHGCNLLVTDESSEAFRYLEEFFGQKKR